MVSARKPAPPKNTSGAIALILFVLSVAGCGGGSGSGGASTSSESPSEQVISEPEEVAVGRFTEEGFYSLARVDQRPFQNVVAFRTMGTLLIHPKDGNDARDERHQRNMRRIACEGTPLICDYMNAATLTYGDSPFNGDGGTAMYVTERLRDLFENGNIPSNVVAGFPATAPPIYLLGLLSPEDAKTCANLNEKRQFYEDEAYYDGLMENGYLDDAILVLSAGNDGRPIGEPLGSRNRGALANISLDCTKRLMLQLQEIGALMTASGFVLENGDSPHQYPDQVSIDPVSQKCEPAMPWCMYLPMTLGDIRGTSTSATFGMVNLGLIRALYPQLDRREVRDLVLACSKDIVRYEELGEDGRPIPGVAADGGVFSTTCLVDSDEGRPRLLTIAEVEDLIDSYRRAEAS